MSNSSIFISYSHKDEEWKKRLEIHLRVLEMQDLLSVWEDRQIEAGDDWYLEIEKALNAANIAVLMITANFLTSNFILGEEVPKLLKRREKEGIRIIPVIVKPCAWTRVNWLSKIQARPKDGRPLSAGSEHQIDTDLSLLAEEIAQIIDGHKLIKKDFSESVTFKIDNEIGLWEKIKRQVVFGDYETAIKECESALNKNPSDSLANLLLPIATLKGKGADRFQSSVIKRLEKHLSNACYDDKYYPTALVVWGLIKYDHYKLNSYWQDAPTLTDLKTLLDEVDLEKINFDIVENIKASPSAYNFLGLSRFLRE